jgi:hypothetical protein
MTGNIVATANAKGHIAGNRASLNVAITGNLVTGPPMLPNCTFPAPFDSWLP